MNNIFFQGDEAQIRWKKHKKHYTKRFIHRLNHSYWMRLNFSNELREDYLKFERTKNLKELCFYGRKLGNLLNFFDHNRIYATRYTYNKTKNTIRELLEKHAEEIHYDFSLRNVERLSLCRLNHYWNYALKIQQSNGKRIKKIPNYVVKTNDGNHGNGVQYFHLHSLHILKPFSKKLRKNVKILDLRTEMDTLLEAIPLVESTGLKLQEFIDTYDKPQGFTKRNLKSTFFVWANQSRSYRRYLKHKHLAEKHDKRTQHKKELKELMNMQFQ